MICKELVKGGYRCGKKVLTRGLCGEHVRKRKMELRVKLRRLREEERRVGSELASLYSKG